MRIILFSLLLLVFEQLSATGPVIGTTTFNNNFSGAVGILSTASPGTATNVGSTGSTALLPSGWDFTVTAPTATVTVAALAGGANPGGATDFCIRLASSTGGVSVQTVAVRSNDASQFNLQAAFLRLNITVGTSADMTITGFRAGAAVSGATKTVTGIPTATWTQFDVSGVPAFQGVDEFRFTQAGTTTSTMSFELVDQITITAASLPLTLIDFSALHSGNDAELRWTTASEQNTSVFEIQRGDNSSDFTTIARLPAAGHSEATLQYSYADHLPATATPAWFYRLKMVDLDGAFTYSPILKFNTTSSGSGLSAWPNPFHQQLTVTMEAAEADKARLTIRDISGRLLIGQDLSIQKGTNSIPLSSLSRLAKGAYLLNIITSRGQQTLRVLKSE
jgi:hypothetical protein